jgi:hypothetical protein
VADDVAQERLGPAVADGATCLHTADGTRPPEAIFDDDATPNETRTDVDAVWKVGVTHDHRAAPVAPDAPFRAFRRLNDPALSEHTSSRGRVDRRALAALQGDRLEDKLLRALVERRALPAKEVWESFEVAARARSAMRRKAVVDLCCGHGLAGLLLAAFERTIEQLWLVDERRPGNHDRVAEAVAEVAPWVAAKVHWLEAPLKRALPLLPAGAGILAVHACGVRSDRAVDAAISGGGPLVMVPCCYEGTAQSAPSALRESLGVVDAADIDRTYRLERAGFSVRWSSLPRAVTPMNRVILALPAAAAEATDVG